MVNPSIDIVTKDFSFSASGGQSVSTTVNLEWEGHTLVGAQIKSVTVYMINSNSTGTVSISVNGNIATVSGYISSAGSLSHRMNISGTVTAYYI